MNPRIQVFTYKDTDKDRLEIIEWKGGLSVTINGSPEVVLSFRAGVKLADSLHSWANKPATSKIQ